MSAVVDGCTAVCPLDAIAPETGVAAYVDGALVAVFRTHDDQVHAVSHVDPFSGAAVLARGIVGSRGTRPVVSSPMYKHAYDLVTGQCLDDETVRLVVYEARVVAETVYVGRPRTGESAG